MNNIYVGSYYTWNWAKMVATSDRTHGQVYELRWNQELGRMECRDMREPADIWREVRDYDKAIEAYKNYVAERELLC